MIQKAIRLLTEGRIIAYPTETLFGLGVDPFQEEALESLVQLKGRSSGKGLICLIENITMLSQLTEVVSSASFVSSMACRLMAAFWPGPLTVVLPARTGLPQRLVCDGTVALRHSSAPVVQKIFQQGWRKPLISTSANPSNRAPACDAETVRRFFGDRVSIIEIETEVDATSSLATPLPSTVISPGEERGAVLLRAGAITIQQLFKAVPDLDLRTPDGISLR